jgi:hypothetical protein
MAVTLPHVVVPYAEFLERREHRVASELRRQDTERTIDAEVVAVAVARPLSTEQKYRYEGPCRVKSAERAT